MEWVETTGKTIDAAKESALDQLGVDAAEAEFETIEEPKSGLFGRTRGVARVRARVLPKAPRPKAERRRRAPKRGEGSSRGADGDGSKRPSQRKGSGSDGRGARSGGSSAATEEAAGTSSSARRDSSTDVPRGTSSGRRHDTERTRDQDTTDRGAREQMDMDEQQRVLEEFTTELATAMGLDATASSEVEDNQLTVNLTGNGLGHLVGPRLVTLDAIQEIARNALQRHAAGREYAKVVVDVGGVRTRRRAALEEFVRDAADQVRDEDVDIVFDVMSSPDRKRVHDLVTEIDGVVSLSEGEDPRRRVVLRPAD